MLKKIITKIHRWLGTLMSLIFVIWFISGIVMIFEGFPHAKRHFQFNQETPFTPTDTIVKALPDYLTDSISAVSLRKHLNRPIYEIKRKGRSKVYDAITFSEITNYTLSDLDALIQRNYGVSYHKRLEINDFDQWIPWSRYKKYFPIYKYYLDDDKHSVIYVSKQTCAVVQETTRYQRWCARFGAIPHWFYYKSLRLKQDLWIDFVIWLALIGCFAALSGMIMGFVRQKKRKKQRRKKDSKIFGFSPYKKKWYRWHHITGYFFGIFALTFVFSGLMSLYDLPEWVVPIKKTANYRKVFSRDNLTDINAYKLSVNDIFKDERLVGTKKIEWKQVAGVPYYYAYPDSLHNPILVNASRADTVLIRLFTKEDIENEFAQKFPQLKYKTKWLTETDGYIGFRHYKAKRLLRFVLEDANHTWLYFDVSKAKLVSVSNKNKRLHRILYRGLHSFNFKIFDKYNGLRIVLLIIVSVFGIIISFSGLILSYNYLKRKYKKVVRK